MAIVTLDTYSRSMANEPILHQTPEGLYCPAGDFYIDPWRPVARAVITHAHSDHARPGSRSYLAAEPGKRILEGRLGVPVETAKFGERRRIGDATVSLHPASHVLGSAQVRVEHRGEVWVVTGDYKTEPDSTCAPFELVPCHTFITECTFGLPVYRWPDHSRVFEDIHQWWSQARDEGRTAVLFAYALGKAQRLISGLDPAVGPIRTHGAVEAVNERYRDSGVKLPPTQAVAEAPVAAGSLVVAPPGAGRTPWMRRLGDTTTAFASGWMQVRGRRRQRAVDRGFVLSDHVDWPALMRVIRDTGAEHVMPTHGATTVVARYLREQGIRATPLATRFGDPEE